MQENASELQHEPSASPEKPASQHGHAPAATDDPPAARKDVAESDQVGRDGQNQKTKGVGASPVSPSNQRYIPQFSASTEMILSRLNGKAGGLSSALSSVSAMAGNFEQAAFEDTKRRIVMSMNTTTTIQAPQPKPTQTPSHPAPGASSIDSLGAFQLREPPRSQLTTPQESPSVPAKRGKSSKGANPKKNKSENPDTPGSGPVSTDDSKGVASVESTPTMTKSGRQVQKPTQYHPPPASTGSLKRKHQGKRTAEQALCKVCTRGLSPAKNQIVFCDGCNLCWHQLCHEPAIDHDYVSNQSLSWFCHRCMAKKEKNAARKKAAAEAPKPPTSWKDKSGEEKRSLLASLPHHQLVDLLMRATELHPDIATLTGLETMKMPAGSSLRDSPRRASHDTAAGSAGPSARGSQPPLTPSTSTGAPTAKFAAALSETPSQGQERTAQEAPFESLPPAWPKVGQGCLAGMDIREDDLRDKNDFEAFSLTSYNAAGRKIKENGIPIATPVKAIVLKKRQ